MAENFGHVDVTRANVDTAFEEFTALGDRWGLATVVAMKAQLQTYDGDLEGAIASYAEAEEYLRALGAHSDEAFMAMRLANLRLRLDDLDGARREIARFDELEDASGFPRSSPTRVAGGSRCARATWPGSTAIRDAMTAQAESSRALGGAHGQALLGTMVALLDVELGDLDAASKSVDRRVHRGAGDEDMPILAGNGTATARLALAYDRCEDAAELLGAAARVRGIEDATDPTIAELFAVLPTGWARRRSTAAYDRGWSLSQADAAKRLDPASLDVTEAEPLEADEVGGVEAPVQARRR